MATPSRRRSWLDRLLGRAAGKPHVPAGIRIYAVGDIHGRDDLLGDLLDTITAHAGDSEQKNSLIFLGDYVDRGLYSKAVIDRLLGLDLADWDIVFLRGNHDQAVLDFLNDPNSYRAWRGFGAAETLLSYGVTPSKFDNTDAFVEARNAFAAALPAAHHAFFEGLKYFHVCGDYVFVHAGLRPGIPLERQSTDDIMWIRDEFLMSEWDFGRVVVHGHTPTPQPVRSFNRIGVDTGAYATGRLTAAMLEDERCLFLTACAPGVSALQSDKEVAV